MKWTLVSQAGQAFLKLQKSRISLFVLCHGTRNIFSQKAGWRCVYFSFLGRALSSEIYITFSNLGNKKYNINHDIQDVLRCLLYVMNVLKTYFVRSMYVLKMYSLNISFIWWDDLFILTSEFFSWKSNKRLLSAIWKGITNFINLCKGYVFSYVL